MTKEEITQKRNEQTMSAQSKAIRLEKILFRMNGISCTKHDGLELGEKLEISAGLIRDIPYHAIENNLYEFEKKYSNKRKDIVDFLSKYHEVAIYSIDEILSIVEYMVFRDRYLVEEPTNIHNGEEYIEQMFDDLKKIIA